MIPGPVAIGYLTLDRLLLPPPGSTLIALALTAGVGDLAWRLAHRLRLVSPVEALLVAIGVMALICAGLHGLVLAGVANPSLLRVCGFALGIAGVWRLLNSGLAIGRALAETVGREWRAGTWIGRGLVASTACALAALYLAALAPATDADSLDYHLGVPLDWLRNGGAVAREDWLTARLSGIGESFSMLGLACGTDAAWAVLQATVFVAFVLALGSLEKSSRERLLVVTAASVAPVLLFLVPSQKPMLLPAVATTLVVAASSQAASWRSPHMALATMCLAFAAACKHSFLFGALVGLALLLFRARRVTQLLASCVVAFVLILAPLYARNLMLYGDPLSPFLERFRQAPSPAVVAFAQYLREFGLGLDWSNIGRMIIPTTAGDVSTVLGAGILALAAIRPIPAGRPVLLSAALLVALIGLAGQVSGRFLFEPYLWGLCGLVGGKLRRRSGLVEFGLVAQGTLTATAAVFLATQLVPGGVTAASRDAVMSRHAFGYVEAKWLEQLPADAVVTTANRSRALLPRAFFVAEAPETGFKPPPAGLEAALRTNRVSALILPTDRRLWAEGYETYLISVCAQRVGDPQTFFVATRNPFNRRLDQTVQLYLAGVCPPG